MAKAGVFSSSWDAGLHQRVRRVNLHGEKRIFRGIDCAELARALSRATFLKSETRGKQIALHFSKNAWLGIHLGMSGKLRVEAPDFGPASMIIFVLVQARRALVLQDPRMFGRVRFHVGKEPPDWWSRGLRRSARASLPQSGCAPGLRRRRVAIKTALTLPGALAGVGNWMADEIYGRPASIRSWWRSS